MPRFATRAGGPVDMLLTNGGRLLVSLVTAGKVIAVDAAGMATTIASGLSSPEGMAAAPDGSIYLVEQGRNRILRMTLDGQLSTLRTFPNSTGKQGIDSIRELDGGHILVPDSPLGELADLDSASGVASIIVRGLGRPVDAIPYVDGYAVADEDRGLLKVAGGAVTTLADIKIPDDLLAGADGALYVTGIGERALFRFRAGAVTRLAGGFGEPQGLVKDNDGSLLIADEKGGAIYRLPPACLQG